MGVALALARTILLLTHISPYLMLSHTAELRRDEIGTWENVELRLMADARTNTLA